MNRWVAMGVVLCAWGVLTACAGAGGGIGGSGGTDAVTDVQTRTVCVPSADPVLTEQAARAVDAWNMGEETAGSLWPECPPYTRCLGRVITHELGHALGLGHFGDGLMRFDSVRSPLTGITAEDYAALPDDTPALEFVDETQCDHAIAWGYPAEPVLPDEVGWYERATQRIWIDPGRAWRF